MPCNSEPKSSESLLALQSLRFGGVEYMLTDHLALEISRKMNEAVRNGAAVRVPIPNRK